MWNSSVWRIFVQEWRLLWRDQTAWTLLFLMVVVVPSSIAIGSERTTRLRRGVARTAGSAEAISAMASSSEDVAMIVAGSCRSHHAARPIAFGRRLALG